jgi:HEAT repeat protein
MDEIGSPAREGPSGRGRRPRQAPLAVKLSFSVALTALLLGGLEATARLREPRRPVPVATEGELWAPEGGEHFYTLKPRAVGWPPSDVNGDGVRDRAHPIEKPEETARVVFLGDSVTEGFGVGPADAYPRLLQAMLGERGERVEVFSVAVQGWSTRQQRIAYHRIARRYRPDLVVVAACLNDIVELEHQLHPPPRLLAWAHARSAFVRWAVAARHHQLRAVEELFRDGARYDFFLDELRVLREEVLADGVAFAVVLFPYGFQVTKNAPPPRVQQAFAAFCERKGMTCLDLLAPMRARGESTFIDESHLSAEGGRVAAAEILGAKLLPHRSYVPRLLEALRREGPQGRAAALSIEQGRAEARDAPALAAALGHPDHGVRAAAAWALGRLGPAAAVATPGLVAALRDPREPVRAAAARALGSLGTAARATVPSLLAALDDERAVVRWESADALARLRVPVERAPELARALGSEDVYVRNFSAWALGEMGEAGGVAARELVEMLFAEEGYDLRGAAEAVRKLGPAVRRAVPAVVSRLFEPDPDRRARAALALGKIGPEAAEAAPALRAALRDPQAAVRANAAFALGNIGDGSPDVVSALLAALSDAEGWVRTESARALGKLEPAGEGPRDALLAALGDPDGRVRVQAARALGRLGRPEPRVLAALDRATRDGDERVQREARDAIAKIGRAGGGPVE